MNGRILRLDLGAHPAAPEVFSQVPVSTGLAGDWMKSMWNDLVFDKAGNLYVPDDKPRIWRVGPDGTASIWFTDPRLTGFFGFAGGPLGGRIDPTGTWLYVSITVSAEFPLESTIYRVRLVDHPTAADLAARPPRSRSTRPRRAAAGDRPRLRQVRQPLRQPDRPEPDRRARPGRQRDRPDLGPAVPLAVGPRLHAASRCWSPTATSSRPTTRRPGRSSRSTSARRACR